MTRGKGTGAANGAGRSLITDESAASSEELGIRNEGGGFAEIDDEVAAVLAFVISSATFIRWINQRITIDTIDDDHFAFLNVSRRRS